MKKIKLKRLKNAFLSFTTLLIITLSFSSGMVLANDGHVCGDPNGTHQTTSIDFGCRSQGNPILDLSFAIIRFLSYGVGIVVVLSIVIGGLQYIGSQGDPNNTSKAIERIRGAIIALLIYIFAFAIINYVVPGIVFSGIMI